MSFTNIQIQQFRGIKNCNIQDFGKHVNLFVGRNNCGKTSVLDALYLLFVASAPRISIDINRFRDFVISDFSQTALLNFYNLDVENTITLKANEINSAVAKRTIDIKPAFPKTNGGVFGKMIFGEHMFDEKRVRGLNFNSAFEINGQQTILNSTLFEKGPFDPNQDTITAEWTVPDNYTEDTKINYINSKAPFALDHSILSNIIVNKNKSIIIDCLRNIDNKIVDISLVDKRVMIDVGISKLLPIEVLGDGVRKALKIILFLYESKNGILLVDEIDNGLHYSSMPILWKSVLDAARLFNVQLFATTHNIDSMKALKSVLEEKVNIQDQDNTVCYRLRKADDDELFAYRYDFEKFGFAIDMDHEIR